MEITFQNIIRDLAEEGRNPEEVKLIFKEALIETMLNGTFVGVNGNK